MSYRMTLENGRTGQRYILTLEKNNEQWEASWRVVSAEETPGSAPAGTVVSCDPYDAFEKAKELIEKEDEDVIGVDWQFEEPLPPWFLE